ncbi:MAG: hypothetical protein HXY28_12060 [Hydrogenophilaceae bacterium]|nr:hypothetical protein [Hydrogenophilaceae bacterium]
MTYPEEWRRPAGREARNEQRKLRAGLFNAFAIAVGVVALFGDIINPAAAATLTPLVWIGLVMLAGALHLFAARLVRDMEARP